MHLTSYWRVACVRFGVGERPSVAAGWACQGPVPPLWLRGSPLIGAPRAAGRRAAVVRRKSSQRQTAPPAPCSRSTSCSPCGVLSQVSCNVARRREVYFRFSRALAAVLAFSLEPQRNVCGRRLPLWGAALPTHGSGWYRGSRRCSAAAFSGIYCRDLSGQPRLCGWAEAGCADFQSSLKSCVAYF